jgi:hypothetical protein
MKLILQEDKRYLIRFDPRDEVMEELKKFCERAGVGGGVFFGVGSSQYLLLSYYNVKKKIYEDYEISEDVEIISFSGSVALKDDKVLVHAHGAFSYPNGKMRGGHVKKLVVSGTCEIYLDAFDKMVGRIYDEITGLNLLDKSL